MYYYFPEKGTNGDFYKQKDTMCTGRFEVGHCCQVPQSSVTIPTTGWGVSHRTLGGNRGLHFAIFYISLSLYGRVCSIVWTLFSLWTSPVFYQKVICQRYFLK